VPSIPILTYHALHAPGWSYASNDHIAFEQDLELIRDLRFRVASLSHIADAVLSGAVDRLAAQRVVGLSFDDGTDHDWVDFSHPGWGHLKSMGTILREQAHDLGLDGGQANATSFVIVSPQAREVLDRTCIAGRGQWRDAWWLEAAESGVLTVANHSWDHVHVSLDSVAQSENRKGSFHAINNAGDAELQISRAERYLDDKLGSFRSGLFAYPYGDASEFLVRDWFPQQKLIRAAFVGGSRYVTAQDSRWAIPRFTCQSDWKSPTQLRRILEAAA
jgi:hypothetical protein